MILVTISTTSTSTSAISCRLISYLPTDNSAGVFELVAHNAGRLWTVHANLLQ